MCRCPNCGSGDLVGGRAYHEVVRYTAALSCNCGAAADGVAALRSYRCPTLLEEWGRLGEDADWQPEEMEVIEEQDEEEVAIQVFCPTCVADADPDDWRVTEDGRSSDRLDQVPFTACNACGAESDVV